MKRQFFALFLTCTFSIQSTYSAKNETPLMQAIASGNTRLAKELIDNGANVKATDENGDTALTRAIENTNEECTKLLLDHGADLFAPNNKGKSPWILALEENKDEEFIKFLRMYKPQVRNAILQRAATYNYPEKSDNK